MANVKITELTAATALAGTDVLPIVDVGADATKKVSVSDLLRNLPDGTASAPALAFADDQNSGILSPAENELAFATSGTQRLVIDGSGNVGIGQSSPVVALQVSGASAARIQLSTDNTGHTATDGVRIQVDSSNNLELLQRESANIEFFTAGTERLRINSAGNVGIGTSSPSTLLHLSSTGEPKLRIQDADLTNRYVEISQAGGGTFFRSRADSSNGNFIFSGLGGGTEDEFLRIDNSGRLLVGLTSATGTTTTPIQIKGGGSIATGITLISGNDESAGGLLLDSSSTNALRIDADPQNLRSGTYVSIKTDGSERLRVDSSGRLLVATSSSTANSNADDLQIGARSDSGERGITVASSAAGSIRFADDGNDTAGYIFYSHSDNSLRFGSDGSERMRIDSSGRLIVGKTVADNATAGITLFPEGIGSFVADGSRSGTFVRKSSNGSVVEFRRDASTVGSISVTTTATSYNESSDYRLKENVVDIADGITRVKQLQPRRFNFIVDPETTVDGFVAHEAQIVVPEAVTGTHNEVDDDGNAVMQGIDKSKLVPLLTAALQEAIAKIETLETKVAALEAQ